MTLLLIAHMIFFCLTLSCFPFFFTQVSSSYFLLTCMFNHFEPCSWHPFSVITNLFQITRRSLSSSATSKCGLLPVPVLSEHRALCKLLTAWFRDGEALAASDLSGSLREHSSTSLTSSSIFLERVVGNDAFTRSNTLSLKTMSRQAKLSMNIPGSTAVREGRGAQNTVKTICNKHYKPFKWSRKYAVNISVPLGVRRLQTFCRNVVSTNAAGGPLIPTVLSLLSTSKMMTSNDRFPSVERRHS